MSDDTRLRAVHLRRTARLALLALVLAGCASPAAPSSTPSGTPAPVTPEPTPAATAAPTPSPVERIEGTFDVGDGRKLYLRCIGSGSPTILLEAGDEDSGTDHWRFVAGPLSDDTRTCVYDRAGLGRSDPATGCRQMDDILDDLDGMLDAAGVEGPYVLVGASGGGFLMAGFAARHPEHVAGMVFVETPKALTAERYPEIVPLIACDAPTNIERRDYLKVEHAAWDNRENLGEFPLTVLSNDYGDSVEPNTDEATNVDDQQGWFDLSPDHAKQVVVTTGHDIASDQPDLVIEEIRAVLAAARAG